MKRSFSQYFQLDDSACVPNCLRMVAKHYGRSLSAQELREAAEKVGFKTLGEKVKLEILKKEATLPCIVHWGQNHFVVTYKISKSHIFVADPAKGLLKYTFQEFESQWATTVIDCERTGVAFLLEPTGLFMRSITLSKKTRA